MTDLVVLAGVVVAVGLAAWWLRRRDGRVLAIDGPRIPDADLERVGVPPGRPALLEFTAPGCRSCVAARHVLHEVAARRAEVVVAVADVAEHPELARAHGVLRAPTTLLIDPGGRVRHRISGVPDAERLDALLAAQEAGRAA